MNSCSGLDQDGMRARIPMAVERTLANLTNGTPDPLMVNFCVDLILPPLESVIRSDETIAVYSDLARTRRRAQLHHAILRSPLSLRDVPDGRIRRGSSRLRSRFP